MEDQEIIKTLTNLCQDKNWFYEVGKDQYNRFVVYVHYICSENFGDDTCIFPRFIDNRQVLRHFASSKTVKIEDYIISISFPNFDQEESILNLEYLNNELDRLTKICGASTLEEIFYEEKDGKNAVTDWSVQYPDVSQRMHQLFDIYGFDLLYEALGL
jgi:hypothetical protein